MCFVGQSRSRQEEVLKSRHHLMGSGTDATSQQSAVRREEGGGQQLK